MYKHMAYLRRHLHSAFRFPSTANENRSSEDIGELHNRSWKMKDVPAELPWRCLALDPWCPYGVSMVSLWCRYGVPKRSKKCMEAFYQGPFTCWTLRTLRIQGSTGAGTVIVTPLCTFSTWNKSTMCMQCSFCPTKIQRQCDLVCIGVWIPNCQWEVIGVWIGRSSQKGLSCSVCDLWDL